MKTKADCRKNSLFSYPFLGNIPNIPFLGKYTSDICVHMQFKNKIFHYYKKIMVNSWNWKRYYFCMFSCSNFYGSKSSTEKWAWPSYDQ